MLRILKYWYIQLNTIKIKDGFISIVTIID